MRIKALKKMLLILALTAPCSTVYAEDVPAYSWDDCVRTALVKNPDLASSREAVSQKEAVKGITRSSLLPQISASASGGKTKSGPELAGSDATNNYSYGLTAKQLVFDGFKSVYDLKGADKDILTARYDYSVTSGTVRFNLKQAYVSLLKNREMLKILEEIKERRKHIMNLVKLKYEAGSEHRGSYYTAKADYLQSEADLKSALREVSLSKKTLCYLMGLDESSQFSIGGDLTLTGTYDDKPDFSVLAAKTPAYLKSVSTSESALYSMKSSRLAFSPEVYGTASAGKSGDSINNISANNWSVGFEITAPLFEGGSTWYASSKAESAYRQALSGEKSVKNEVMKSLEESWNSLKDSIDNVEVQKASLDAALERSKIGEARYSIGTLSFDNWTIIESNLASAKKTYHEACAASLTAEARWIQSTGGTLDNESKK